MGDILRFLIFVGCIFLSHAAGCEDVDTKACEMMALKQPNFCADSCLSKLCTRFCGHCPVKCYQCHEIDDPANCTNLVECPSMDHYCYTTQTFSDDFTEVYKLGCAMKDICQQYLGPDHKKRNIDVNGACCMEDKCNNRLPLLIITGAQLPTQMPSVNQVNITADPDVCENLDDMACSRFKASKHDVCSDTCFAANVCPRMCGKCFNCYTCNDINTVHDCNTTNVCHAGHECFTLETLSLDLRPVFRVGCMEEQLCARFKANSQSIFGRRDGFAMKGGCCKTDLCNDHIEVYHPPTTIAPHHTTSKCAHPYRHCPHGFASSGHHSCYMIGPNTMTWGKAKHYCESHCARLVDFSSHDEMMEVFELLIPHHGNRYQDARVWTDATFTTIPAHWKWNHNNQWIKSNEFYSLVNSHPKYDHCAYALVHTYGSRHPTLKEVLLAEDCDRHLLPLCEAPRS